MSLSPQEIASLAALGAPVLCVDTCTVLDVIRDITRETVMPSDVAAGLALLAAAETGSDLVVLMAEQVDLVSDSRYVVSGVASIAAGADAAEWTHADLWADLAPHVRSGRLRVRGGLWRCV